MLHQNKQTRGAAFGVPPKAYKGGPGGRPPVAGVFHGRGGRAARGRVLGEVLIFQSRGRVLGEVLNRGQRPPAQAFADAPHVNKTCIKIAKINIKNEKGEILPRLNLLKKCLNGRTCKRTSSTSTSTNSVRTSINSIRPLFPIVIMSLTIKES